MANFETQQKVLREPFNIEIHKKTFINYLEVIIDTLGVVHYSIPSHQQWLMNRYMQLHQCTTNDLICAIPKEYYLDIMEWLTKETQCIAVWNEFIVGNPNKSQCDALLELQNAGLYKGVLEYANA